MSVIRNDIVRIIAVHMDVCESNVKNSTGLFKDLGMNAFEMEEVMDDVGRRFGIELDDDWRHMSSVGDVVEVVKKKIVDKSNGRK